jgi:hypothetical protein
MRSSIKSLCTEVRQRAIATLIPYMSSDGVKSPLLQENQTAMPGVSPLSALDDLCRANE